MGGGWTFEDEIYFNKQLVDKQFEKVNFFIETKINHLSLEEVRPLLDFIHLNTIGFKKILKKHDKWTEFTLAHKYNRYWDNYITMLQDKLDIVYHLRTFWVHKDHLNELEAILLFRSPKQEIDPVQFVYYDQLPSFQVYMDFLKKKEPTELIKMTWHDAAIVTFDQKVFVDHEKSFIKERSFRIESQLVKSYLGGEPMQFSCDEDSRTASAIRETIQSKSLKPIIKGSYKSTKYSDQGITLLLKKNLVFMKEQHESSGTLHDESYYFPYALLEIKSAVHQEMPDWLIHLTDVSRLVYEVPYFIDYAQGAADCYSDQLQLLPWWLPELTKDIYKAPGQDDAIFLEEKDVHANSSMTVLEITRDDQNTYNKFMSSAIVTKIKNLPPMFKDNRDNQDDMTMIKWLVAKVTNNKQLLEPTKEDPRIMPKNGKVKKLEPKIFFANERTFISWLQFSAFLLTMSLALINFGDHVSRTSGGIFIMVAVILAGYALLRFQYRAWQIRFRSSSRFDDMYGPAIICFVFVLALLANFGLRVSQPVTNNPSPFGKSYNVSNTQYNMTHPTNNDNKHNHPIKDEDGLDNKDHHHLQEANRNNTTRLTKHGKIKEEDEDED
ncbi:hypothetical protein RMCBS344292_14331 [Rhizopus microsporus]|nr:hypothetical protein RMCBS344292_14331 [Rhizopus microsporus]